MNEGQEALQASIWVWEKVEGMEHYTRLSVSEPLCDLYKTNDNGCMGCPVAKALGKDYCEGGTWEKVDEAHLDWAYYRSSKSADDLESAEVNAKTAFKEAVTAHVEFLKALLPKEVENGQ